jgi:hypothetical protein
MMMNDRVLSLFSGLLVGIGTWWTFTRVFRGTGKSLGLLFSLVMGGFGFWNAGVGGPIGILLIVAGSILEILQFSKKKEFSHSHLIFEGGGIRRGLSPVEVGFLNDLSPSGLFVLGLIDLLQKGLIEYSKTADGGLKVTLVEVFWNSRAILNPKSRRDARKSIAQRRMKELTDYEDVLLETLDQNADSSIGEFSIQHWIEYLNRSVNAKTSGFDIVETNHYYFEFIKHRLMSVESGYFKPLDYIGWMVLNLYLNDKNGQLTYKLLKKTRPSWLTEGEDLVKWLNFVKSVAW